MAAAAVAATVAAKKGNALDAFLKRHGDNVVGGVFKLRGQNEELQENDLAHEGFGTVEDKYAERPLIGYLPCRPGGKDMKHHIRSETVQLIQDLNVAKTGKQTVYGSDIPEKERYTSKDPNVRITERKLVLTKHVLAIGAEFDQTGEIKADQIPCIEIVEARTPHHGIIEVVTELEGYNSGRTYRFRPPMATIHGWLFDIQNQADKAHAVKDSTYLKYKRIVALLYEGGYVQALIAIMILMNFFMLCAESQLQPGPKSQVFYNIQSLDLFFTVIFTIEIFVNLWIFWFKPFFRNGWNILDAVIITIAWVTMICRLSGAVDVRYLEPTRAFRIFRLAGKVPSLRRIVDAIRLAIVPMCYAFFISAIFTSIFAVLGTEFYKDRDPTNFGTFSRTMFTVWWAIAFGNNRSKVPIFNANNEIDWAVLLFSVFLVVILIWICLQIIVAVLLDNFVGATTTERQKAAKAIAARRVDNMRSFTHLKKLLEAEITNIDTGGLEPLLEEILKLFDTSDQLSRGIKKIFHNIDYDRAGFFGYRKLAEGLRKLNTHKPILLTEADFEVLIDGGRMCSSDRTINEQQFETIMRRQLKEHVQRDLTDVMAMNRDQIETRTLLASHRILHVNDQYEHIKSVCTELKEAYNEFNLMRANCLADMNQIVALTSTAVESKKSDSGRGDGNEQVDAVLEKRLARELRARHAAQSMEMHELKTIVTGLKESLEMNTATLMGGGMGAGGGDGIADQDLHGRRRDEWG